MPISINLVTNIYLGIITFVYTSYCISREECKN